MAAVLATPAAPSSPSSSGDAFIDAGDSATSRAASQRVRAAIVAEDARIRAAWPLLRAEWQSWLALAIWAVSLTAMIVFVASYAAGLLSALVVIPLVAFSASLLHELEHDLIHGLYFRGRARVTDAMLTGIWIAKLSLNPWTRRSWHLNHHRRSGQVDDVEERLIGLGMRSAPARLAIAIFPWLSVFIVREVTEAAGGRFRIRRRGAFFSLERAIEYVDVVFYLAPLLAAAVTYGAPRLLAGSPTYAATAVAAAAVARVVLFAWALPNVLRHASLVIMSSCSHYYEDVAPGNVQEQNQILRHWLFTPLQLFCVNFGAEHVIHHYVVHQPFWMRHAVRKLAWRVLEEKCV